MTLHYRIGLRNTMEGTSHERIVVWRIAENNEGK